MATTKQGEKSGGPNTANRDQTSDPTSIRQGQIDSGGKLYATPDVVPGPQVFEGSDTTMNAPTGPQGFGIAQGQNIASSQIPTPQGQALPQTNQAVDGDAALPYANNAKAIGSVNMPDGGTVAQNRPVSDQPGKDKPSWHEDSAKQP